jgi:hypothetical protein
MNSIKCSSISNLLIIFACAYFTSFQAIAAESLPLQIDSKFIPSGWMGDGKIPGNIELKRVREKINGKSVVAIKIHYTPSNAGWAGIYWQFPEGNWGRHPGLDFTGASKITFYARGETGKEIVEFKAGGMDGKCSGCKHKDSFESTVGKVPLSTVWEKFTIELSDRDLSNVIGAFSWNAAAADNGKYLTFYLSDIKAE